MRTLESIVLVFTTLFCGGVAVVRPALAESVPVTELRGVTLRASDLRAMRNYYNTRAGFRVLPSETRGGLRVGVGAQQWIEFEPGAWKEYVIRFQGVTFGTPSVRALEAALRARGVIPMRVGRTLEVRDPAGHRLRFVEIGRAALSSAPAKAAPGFSQHLQHIGIVVNRAIADETIRFYAETLGLEEIFRMSSNEGRPNLIKYKLAGPRFDVIELIFSEGPMNKWGANSAYHVNFAVDDIDATYCELVARGLAAHDRHLPKVNAERLWAIDMIDPEFTRVEIQVISKAAQEIGTDSNPRCGRDDEPLPVWNGKDLTGWRAEEGIFRIENGELLGESRGFADTKTFLWHESAILRDFYLSVWVKQIPGRDRRAAIHFRVQPVNDGNPARGYAAGIGTGAWGRLDHEGPRGRVQDSDHAEAAVKWEDWNHYEILAIGNRIWTAVNGVLAVAVEDTLGERVGRLAVQLHLLGPQTLRLRDLKVLRNPTRGLAGLDQSALVAKLRPAMPPPENPERRPR